MIFYFSGTGNSLYAAEKLHEAETGELINITDALNKKQFNYKVSEGEKIGIIFPVYYCGLPTIVSEFISQLTIENSEKPFIYTVITCGSSIGHADKMLANLLQQKDLLLSSVFSIEMPSNYVMLYDTKDKENQNSTLKSADKEIQKIIKLLEVNQLGDFSNHGYIAILTPFAYKLYGFYRKTKKFYSTDACNSCGLCEEICPSKTIKLTEGKPEWIKDKCSHCTACINRCPTKAIQYGNSTKKRGRYVNPNVKFASSL